MKCFYDSEFVERGPQIPIQPISFGFVREDGQELYVINADSLSNLMRHPWVSVNVRPMLPIREDSQFIFEWDQSHPEYPAVLALDNLIQQVHKFLTDIPDLELWAYYGAYDHVTLCQLFGSMAELPPGIPMFTHDLQQLIEEHPEVKLPNETENIHHALDDARWVHDAYNQIMNPPERQPENEFGYIN
jgi:hypothetical protein